MGTSQEELAYAIGVQAYVYGYPTMDLYRTFYENTLDPKRGHDISLNEFNLSLNLVTPEDDWVVTPNNDTLYLRGFFDLSNEPIVLTIPDVGERKYWFPIGDMYHNLNASLSWDTVGPQGGNLALCAPGWKGLLPDGVQRVDLRTPMVWTVGRYQVNGPDDVAAVNVLQKQTFLAPLSLWGQESPARPQVIPKEYPVYTRNELTDAEQFYTVLNEMFRRNPPVARDEGILNLFREIGLHPAQRFDWTQLDEGSRKGLERAVATGHQIISERTKTFAPVINGWVEAMLEADMGADIVNHAGASMMGLLYSQKEVSTYHISYIDGDGKPLDGTQKYILHLDPTPPVDAFWSLTMYRAATRLYTPNPIDRYAFGDRTPDLHTNEDGSVTIYIQKEAPSEPKKKANWLPAPAESFYMVLREYSPKAAILTRAWEPPAVKKAS